MMSARLIPYWPILPVALLSLLPAATSANTVLNFAIFALIIALSAQGWNILAGYGGQFSFGHAVFFGMGAYGTAICQVRFGINPWIGCAVGVALAAIVGAVIGYLSFRSGLRGSYFALVTLAFAEVFRILFNASSFTGGAAGLLIKLDVRPENFQFANRAAFFWIALALVAGTVGLTIAISRSRFGMWLVAIRENEDAARALGVDVLRIKLKAITLSAAITGAAGCLYVQYFLYLDANIGFGTWISVETLMAPIVGGTGTVLGPVIGALALQGLSETTKGFAGRIPGIDLMLFAALLILSVAFMRDGLVGQFRRVFHVSGGWR
jgi:branched-chain amino acid transport system permease protein